MIRIIQILHGFWLRSESFRSMVLSLILLFFIILLFSGVGLYFKMSGLMERQSVEIQRLIEAVGAEQELKKSKEELKKKDALINELVRNLQDKQINIIDSLSR